MSSVFDNHSYLHNKAGNNEVGIIHSLYAFISMTIAVLSVNHNLAPIEIREQVAFVENELATYLKKLKNHDNIKSCVILSTCNRSEIYVQTSTNETTHLKENLTNWLQTTHNIQTDLTPYLDFYTELEAIKHIISVASGLNSLVLGEPQILGQLKDAYHFAKSANTLDSVLEKLFQQTFKIAKKIRTQTQIGSSPVSVAYCSIKLAQKIFTDLSQQTVLLIGAGEMIELCAKHLNEQKIKKIIIANRTLEKAQLIAKNYQNSAVITLNDLHQTIDQADIIISSTASPVPILGKGLIEYALKKRKHKPMFILDIAVPRDVEPEISQLKDAYLYTIDDLSQIIEQNTQNRQEAKTLAEKIINKESLEFQTLLNTSNNDKLIKNYRTQSEEIKRQVLEKALKKIKTGAEPKDVLTLLADQLTNKLLHHPSQTLKSLSNIEDLETAKKILIK